MSKDDNNQAGSITAKYQSKKAIKNLAKNSANRPLDQENFPQVSLQNTQTTSKKNVERDQLIKINEFRLQNPQINGSGLSTVIIGTGIDLNHPMFGADNNKDGIADRIVYQYDFADYDPDASDKNGQGSNVASIVAGSATNMGGVTYTGIAPGANIIALKVFQDDGFASFLYVEQALQWVIANAANYNIASVNITAGDGDNLSGTQELYGIGDELEQLAQLKIITVAPSGNKYKTYDSTYGVSYPGSDANVLSIGATYTANIGEVDYEGLGIAYSTRPDQITPFSQRMPGLTTIFAPGAPISGANATGGVSTYQGTSQAAAIVSGAVVLTQQLALQKLGRRLTFEQIEALLRSTGKTIYDGDDENDDVNNPNPPQAYKSLDMEAIGKEINALSNIRVNHSITASATSVIEENASSKTVQFRVTRTGSVNTATTINYALGGTATLGTDYTLASVQGQQVSVSGNTISFGTGSTQATITVRVLGDNIEEPNENISVNLTDAVSSGIATISTSLASTTIVNDDFLTFSINDPTLGEGNTPTKNATFLITTPGAINQTVTVKYSTQNGSAISTGTFADYLPQSGTLTFNPRQTVRNIVVSVRGDSVYELAEDFRVVLSDPSLGTLTKPVGTATLLNDDPLGIIRINDASVTEGNSGITNANFLVTLSNVTQPIVRVRYATRSISGRSGGDFITHTGTLTFTRGETVKTISVQVLGDTNYEASETFALDLSDATNSTIGDPTGLGFIANDDPLPLIDYRVRTLSTTVVEGANPTITPTAFVVSRNSTKIPSSVEYNFTGTATQFSDYKILGFSGTGVTFTANRLSFAVGASLATITVNVLGDAVFEPNETINLNLSNPDTPGAILSVPNATTTIANDDPLPGILVYRPIVTEGNSGNTLANFQVFVTTATSRPITVKYTTQNDTARAGSDYIPVSGILTFTPGERTKTISISVIGDTNYEENEIFTLNFSDPVGATLTTSSFSGTINNDDFTLTGTSAAEVLVTNWQNNTLIGGGGNDTLTSGPGNDLLVYNVLSDRTDTITDFFASRDKIVLTNLLSSIGYTGTNPITSGVVRFSPQGSATMVNIDSDGTSGSQLPVSLVLVQNITPAILNSSSNFIF